MARLNFMGLTARHTIATAIIISVFLIRWCFYHAGDGVFNIIPTISVSPNHSEVTSTPPDPSNVNSEPSTETETEKETETETEAEAEAVKDELETANTTSVPDKVVVMAKLQKENTDWVTNELLE
jgi:hypothetical protein